MFKKIMKLSLYFIIPIFLLCLGIVFSFYLNSSTGLTVLSYPYHKQNFTNFTTKELHAHQKVSAEFTGRDKNLGIVSVRFYNFDRINSDEVIFRIKEKNADNWIYEHAYKVDQFLPNKLFTFGFTPIPDSLNKIYYFEIESLHGKKGDAITLSSEEPVFTAQHQYIKHELTSNPTILAHFLTQKMINQFQDISFIFATTIYLLPFIFYLVWLLYVRKYLSQGKRLTNYTLFTLYLIVLFISVFLTVLENTLIGTVFLILWGALIIMYKFESSISFLLACCFLLLSPLFLLFHFMNYAEHAAVVGYLLLLAGTFESIIEVKRQQSYEITYSFVAGKLGRVKHWMVKLFTRR